jgi:hypothetical protein
MNILTEVEGVIWREIEEVVVEGKRLGRHFHSDEAENNRPFPAPLAPKVVSVIHKTNGLPLDQGQLGSCTANALVGALNSAPNLGAPVVTERRILQVRFSPGSTVPRTETDAVDLYGLETRMEGQPYPPNDPGGSGIMVCRAAQSLGWIKDYAHTYSMQHALMALTLRPVIMGTPWYDSFDQPDAEGLVAISPNAGIRGGHEILAVGISIPRRLVYFCNSWGTTYGVALPEAGLAGGSFSMSFDTFEALLASENGGDITVPLV